MSKKYWILIGKKIIETVISVKVLTIATLLAVSTTMAYDGVMTGGEWAAINGGVISTIFALREGFKIARIRKNNHNNSNDEMVV